MKGIISAQWRGQFCAADRSRQRTGGGLFRRILRRPCRRPGRLVDRGRPQKKPTRQADPATLTPGANRDGNRGRQGRKHPCQGGEIKFFCLQKNFIYYLAQHSHPERWHTGPAPGAFSTGKKLEPAPAPHLFILSRAGPAPPKGTLDNEAGGQWKRGTALNQPFPRSDGRCWSDRRGQAAA